MYSFLYGEYKNERPEELTPKCVVNLGVGVPEGIARIANEEDLLDSVTLTAEPGAVHKPSGEMAWLGEKWWEMFGIHRQAKIFVQSLWRYVSW